MSGASNGGIVQKHGVIVGTPGVVVCIDHRPAAMCHRDHKSGLCICRPNFDVKTGERKHGV